jgi:hypothetical protein
MQNKRMFLVMGVLVLVVGAAAFIGGRMLNSNVGPLGLFGLRGKGDVMSFAINVIPAEELPKTPPEAMGLFVERKDKMIVIQSFSLDAGGKGVVVAKGGGEAVAGTRVDGEIKRYNKPWKNRHWMNSAHSPWSPYGDARAGTGSSPKFCFIATR